MEVVFKYDAEFKAALGRPGTWHASEGATGLESLAGFADFWLPRLEKFLKENPVDTLYYGLMDFRGADQAFFVPHDLQLLVADIAANWSGAISLLDWSLLPAAILLAGQGRQIVVPEEPEIVEVLRKWLPEGGWQAGGDEKGKIVLGFKPGELADKEPGFVERLKGASAGIFVCATAFLNNRGYAYLRKNMIEAGLIQSVLELPWPRRQKAVFYPAVMAFKAGEKSEDIRLARIASCPPGPGVIDMGSALNLMFGESEGKESREVAIEEISADGKYDLYPQRWLGKGSKTAGLKLRDVAFVGRCQIERHKVEDCEGVALGRQDDDTYICREITLSEIDPLTGFVSPSEGTLTRLESAMTGRDAEYLLQKGDVLMFYRGTDSTLGLCGFVEEVGETAIPSRALCLIRPLPKVDPVWIFYWLRQEGVMEAIQNAASGGRVRLVSLDFIRDLSLSEPGEDERELISEIHGKIAKDAESIKGVQAKMAAEMRQIKGLLKGSE